MEHFCNSDDIHILSTPRAPRRDLVLLRAGSKPRPSFFQQALPDTRALHHIVGVVMSIETKTQRVHRTWFERLKMWRHAYETKIFDYHHETVGRGPSPKVARDAALRRWNEQIERWKEQNAKNE